MNFSGGKIRWGFLVILGIIVSVSFASFSLRNAIHDTVAQSANVGNASPVAQADTGPKYFYFNKISGAIPKVTASAYLVGDLDTGEIILTKTLKYQLVKYNLCDFHRRQWKKSLLRK